MSSSIFLSALRYIHLRLRHYRGLRTVRHLLVATVTLSVEFGGIAKDPWGNIKAGFEVTGKIKRKEFGLQWDVLTEAGGAVVGDEVKIHANVEYAKVVA